MTDRPGLPDLVKTYETTDLPREEKDLADANGWSLLEVMGDSMEPVYRSGDFVWMKPRPFGFPPKKGEDLVIWWDDGLQIKRYDPDPDGIHEYDRYVPLNSAYPAFVRGKAKQFRIYGVVVRLAKRKA